MTKITLSLARLILCLSLGVVFASIANGLPDSKPKTLAESLRTGDFAWLDTWKPPGRLQEWFPFFKLGQDFEGLPVFLCPYGRWDFRKLVVQGTTEEKDAMATFVDFTMGKFVRGAAESEGGGSVIIYDWDGFAISSYAHPEGEEKAQIFVNSTQALRMTLHMFRELAESQKAITYGFSINTNFAADSFLNIARPYLGNYLDKFEIYGTKKEKWSPRLLAKIPPDSLITQYGGKLTLEGFNRL